MKLAVASTNITEGGPSKGDHLLMEAARNQGLEAIALDPTKISCSFCDGHVKVYDGTQDISDVDILIVRRTRGAERECYELGMAMQANGTYVIDPPEALIYPTAKMVPQLERFEHGYAPEGVYIPQFSEQILEAIVLQNLNFPLFIKPQNGTKGRGSRKVESREDVEDYFRENPGPAIIQEYLEEETCIRVLTVGGETIGWYFCVGTKKYQGYAKATEIAESVVKDNPTTVIGVDITITRDGNYYVLECNRNPDFTADPKNASRYARAIVNYCIGNRKAKEEKGDK